MSRRTSLTHATLVVAAMAASWPWEAGAAGVEALTQETLVPGRCLHSKKNRQVACVNAFTEDGTGRWHSVEFFSYAGDPVRSLAVDDAGRPPSRQDPNRFARPNAHLAENGFEPIAEGVFEPDGTPGPVNVPGSDLKAEVRDDSLVFSNARKTVLKVRLPVQAPDVARIVALVPVPGTKVCAVTLMLAPEVALGGARPATWSTVVVRVP